MKYEFLARYDLIGLNCFALLLFFGIFVAVLLWVFRKSRSSLYQYMKELPLGDDKQDG